MRVVLTLTILATVALTAVVPVCHSRELPQARAEILPIDDKDRAKMAKEEMKRKRDVANTTDDDFSLDTSTDAQCGSVQIGNKQTVNNTAVGQIVPQTTTVIVTGSVINTANCGR
jgi:hypothetical protein